MTKLVALTLLSAVILVAPAYADDTPAGVASDVGSVQKDNQNLRDTNSALARDRAAKAQDKANGNWGGQAVDSVKIGYDKVVRGTQQTGKSSDTQTLNNDVNSATTK